MQAIRHAKQQPIISRESNRSTVSAGLLSDNCCLQPPEEISPLFSGNRRVRTPRSRCSSLQPRQSLCCFLTTPKVKHLSHRFVLQRWAGKKLPIAVLLLPLKLGYSSAHTG